MKCITAGFQLINVMNDKFSQKFTFSPLYWGFQVFIRNNLKVRVKKMPHWIWIGNFQVNYYKTGSQSKQGSYFIQDKHRTGLKSRSYFKQEGEQDIEKKEVRDRYKKRGSWKSMGEQVQGEVRRKFGSRSSQGVRSVGAFLQDLGGLVLAVEGLWHFQNMKLNI